MGKGGSAPSQPATTTQIQDIPDWERSYVEDLLGQAQTIAAQPYQAFPGPKVAGFTDNQNQAFSNIQNQGAVNLNNQQNALQQAGYGANSANSIYNAGQGYLNQATQYNPLAAVAPYLGAANQYNSANAAQPWLNQAASYTNAAANVATPEGIQAYLSPYTSNVVQGLENEANQNWNQNIMPGVNDKFIGSGQYASGRNAQVLGQAAGNFQTGLSANVANALQNGYTTAGQQAQAQAGILGNLANTSLSGAGTASNAQTSQVQNLLSQANQAGTSTQQQAANLQSAGTNLGNLAATQSGAQQNAGKTLGDLGAQSAQTNLAQNQALQGVGQQQQQLNQANLDAAKQDWTDQTNWGKTQTEYLNQIIRGLPAPVTTVETKTPAYSVSPLAAIGSAGSSALSLVGQASQNGLKEGGMVKGYAAGGVVEDDEDLTPLDQAAYTDEEPVDPSDDKEDVNVANPLDAISAITNSSKDEPVSANMPVEETKTPLATASVMPSRPVDNSRSQQEQLLALARGLATPTLGGSFSAAFAQGLGNMQEVRDKERALQAEQNNKNFENQIALKKIGIQQETADALKSYRENGGGAGNRMVAVVGPDGKTMYTTAKEAQEKGYSPISGYNSVNVTLPEKSIEMLADSVAKGAKLSDLGLGTGNNANKQAVMKKVTEKYPDVILADAQTQLIGDRAAARTIGTSGGKIEFASESLSSMIPLAREASKDLDRSKYPSVNAIENAIAQGTGDTKIVALNTYLNAVMADQASLFVRGGDSTDSARAKAEKMANAALSDGQLNTYFDSVENEIKAQRSASKNSIANITSRGLGGGATPKAATTAPVTSQADSLKAAIAAERARRAGGV